MRAALFLAALAGACAQTEVRAPAMDDARSLAAAETAFAAHSVREDMRAAFLANFADDGVFVRGGWTNARASLTPRAAPPIVLDWRPVFTEVSASGDMGLSTGPSKITSKANPAEPPGYGQFVSVWKREPGGPWRVVADLGIAHAQPVFWDKPLETVAVATEPAAAADTIDAAEERFAAEAKANGLHAAYAKHGSASLRPRRREPTRLAGSRRDFGAVARPVDSYNDRRRRPHSPGGGRTPRSGRAQALMATSARAMTTFIRLRNERESKDEG